MTSAYSTPRPRPLARSPRASGAPLSVGPQRSPLRVRALLWLHGLWVSAGVGVCVGAPLADPVGGAGVWVPALGEVGKMNLQWLSESGDGALYALGSGEVYRLAPSEAPPQSGRPVDQRWRRVGAYAPELVWDEGEGVSASGPFTLEVLTEIERVVGGLIEEAMDDQGDDTWLSEDTVSFIIESYVEEEDPPIDSPYRLSDLYPSQTGVWVGTGAGLWGTNVDQLVPIGGSPGSILSVTQAYDRLWVSTPSALWTWRTEQESWTLTHQLSGATLAAHGGLLWVISGGELYTIASPEAPLTPYFSPSGTPQQLIAGGDGLWLLTSRALYRREGANWLPCVAYPSPPTQVRWSEGWLVAVSPEAVWLSEGTCGGELRVVERPQLTDLGFRDAIVYEGRLYAATTDGLFAWRGGGQVSKDGFAVVYLKRELAAYPPFDEVYAAALDSASLNPRATGYGLRPVLSALLPQVTARFLTTPRRTDDRPTFSEGNRQLTLLQPVPNYMVLAEWDLSFDFIARLFNPDLGGSYSEIQAQLQSAVDSPGADLALEAEFGITDDWSDDTYTTQAQRLAATTVALQRRQEHRDRAQLRLYLHRLYRERLDLTYQRWLTPPEGGERSQEFKDLSLRVAELDALLSALTGYRLQL
jgi:hypothetical protein